MGIFFLRLRDDLDPKACLQVIKGLGKQGARNLCLFGAKAVETGETCNTWMLLSNWLRPGSIPIPVFPSGTQAFLVFL